MSTARNVAPHSGHVSNFCRRFGAVIEPADVYCFPTDPCEPLADVHGGHPVWTRLELARGGPDSFRMRRNPFGTSDRNFPPRDFCLASNTSDPILCLSDSARRYR